MHRRIEKRSRRGLGVSFLGREYEKEWGVGRKSERMGGGIALATEENKGLLGAASPCLACKLTSVLRATIQTPLAFLPECRQKKEGEI